MGSIPALLMKLGLGSGSDHEAIVSINLFVTLLCACIVLGHLLEESKWINESITALIIGLSTGGVILLTTGGKSSRILVFSEDLFFNYLLPPIIFNAGFQVKKKQFFRNFGTITFFGALGTIISFVIISAGAYLSFRKYDITPLESADYLAIGVIFSATDSVCTLQVLNQAETPLLYSLVFGEGVVNDATSVVLFNAVQSLDLGHINSTNIWTLIFKFLIILGSSTGLGVAIGLTSAYAIKKLYFGRHSTDREVALMILMSYLSYMLAEVWGSYFSAILTVFFCGIVMSHYTWHNVTESSRITTKHAFATMSFIAETFIFLYVGMDALDIEKWRLVVSSPGKTIGLSSMLLVLVMLGRAAFVFPLSLVANLLKNAPSEKINFKQQVIIWWAGLMRGSVSMALAYNQFTRSGHTQLQGNAIMITCTITLVLFSTMVFGMLTKPLVRLLLPHDSNTINGGSASESSSPKSFLFPFFGDVQYTDTSVRRPTSLRLLLTMPTSTVHYYWRKFDDAYMRPIFGGRGFVPFVPGSPTEESSNQHSAFLQ